MCAGGGGSLVASHRALRNDALLKAASTFAFLVTLSTYLRHCKMPSQRNGGITRVSVFPPRSTRLRQPGNKVEVREKIKKQHCSDKLAEKTSTQRTYTYAHLCTYIDGGWGKQKGKEQTSWLAGWVLPPRKALLVSQEHQRKKKDPQINQR